MTFRLRTWMLLAAAIILIPMVAILVQGYRYVEHAERDRVEAVLRAKSVELRANIERRLAIAVQTLEVLALSDEAQKQNWFGLHALAKSMAEDNPAFQAVSLVDAQNRLVFVSSTAFGPPGFNTSFVDLVNKVLTTGKANVSGPFKVPLSDHYLIAVSVPVKHESQIKFVLRMILRVVTLHELLSAEHFPKDWVATLVDSKGTVISRSNNVEAFIGKSAPQALLSAIATQDGHQYLYRGRTADGTPTTAFLQPVFDHDWWLNVAVPDTVLEALSRPLMLKTGALILMLILLSVAVNLGITQFLYLQTNALEQVVAAGKKLLDLPRPLRVTELAEVDRRFRAVSASEQTAQSALVTVTLENEEISNLYNFAPCGYHSLDAKGMVVHINQTELNWLGRQRDEVLGKSFTELITAASREAFKANYPRFLADGHIENLEYDMVRADGSVFPVAISAVLVRDASGQPIMSRSTMIDITERKEFERRLQALSNTDPLTGLANRRHFYELLNAELERSKRHGATFSLAMLDIDHFKRINDRFGHAMGDQVLKTLAEACRTELRQLDVMARFGGEEFVIFMPHTQLDPAVAVCERLREALQALSIDADKGQALRFTVSIGVAEQVLGETDIDAILMRADGALYEAKRLGRNQVRMG